MIEAWHDTVVAARVTCTDKMETLEADICVVGTGIVGLAHALEARRRNLRVVVLDRDARAVGASVRNFGHVFTAAVADGEDLECALLARERWLELADGADVGLVTEGTVVIARSEDELAVLEAAAANERRGARMITGPQAGDLAPIPTGELCGALHAGLDLRVDPRRAVGALAGRLLQDPGAELRLSASLDAVEPGVVMAGAGLQVRAPVVLVCPGADYRSLPSELRPGLEDLQLCRLQMLRVASPGGRRFGPALATGLSLIRYPAFAGRPEAEPLRARIEAERPELVASGIHLLVTQLAGGDLVVGDTHDYDQPPSPFSEERLDDLLLAEAVRLLGADRLSVCERWQGLYPTSPIRGMHRTEPLPGVHVLEVTSGLGMTMSFGYAVATLDSLTGGAAGGS
jgi:FAD dependent oxidoreductase TIGR03364